MREIKFRAQDIASNKWLYGDVRHHKNDVCIFEQGVYVCEDLQIILIKDQESYGLWEPIEKNRHER